MSDSNELVGRYLAIWNERDATARRAAIAGVWTETGSYTDPLASVRGHENLDAVVGAAQAQFPGLVFEPLGDVDAHHDLARFGWRLVPAAGGESLVEGFDVAVLAEDGRIQSVYGFLDKVPAA
ncbi:nuclear transport factor 2 family protein [Rugosimonospora acidiphila]|uniref:Nuclear transport factor 2 family protein n=1 Tax=Rugosimonospora acidiphila TaxID=556531 RepID=A0ABP9RRD4_9ACTN